MGSQFKLFHANEHFFLYSVKLKGVSYRKKLNCLVCLDQLVDGLEGKYNDNAQQQRQIWARKLTVLETSP